MAKTVYLVVSDLHFDHRTAVTRVNYPAECRYVQDVIVTTVNKYREQGARVRVLLLGDIFTRGYSDSVAAAVYNNWFVLLSSIAEIFVCLGNHEITYYKGNPFYSLVTNIESERVRNITGRVLTPLGIIPVMRVVDTLEDGEVVFYFNHNRTAPIRPTDDAKYNVGLFHGEYLCEEIRQQAMQEFGTNCWGTDFVDIESSTIFDGYRECYFGHFHTVYGSWRVQNRSGWETNVYYLASLGRSQVSEVLDTFLQRNIPAIVVEDGRFVERQDNLFELMPEQECVKFTIRDEIKEKNAEIKRRKEIVRSVNSGNNPLDDLLLRCTSELQRTIASEIIMNGVSTTCVDAITRSSSDK